MSRRSRTLTLALAGALAALVGAVPAPPAHAEAVVDDRLEARVDRASDTDRLPVLVVLDRPAAAAPSRTASPARRIAELKRRAAATQAPIDALTDAPDRRFWLVNAVATSATPDEIRDLADQPGVAWVGADVPVRIAATAPATGATPWNLVQLGAPTAWSTYGVDGTGVTVGSIDTGVDPGHPALAGRVAGWRDFVSGSATPYDDNGHGTHTIGTMIGRGRGVTPLGVAPGARVVVAKAMDAKGYGSGSALIAAAQWIADPDGDPSTDDAPDVVNNSWGTSAGNNPWFRSVVRAWIDLGIVPVFAAGNTGPGPGTVASPADYPESLAVGAVDASRRVAAFSSRGAAGGPVKPDVVAPGAGIASSVPGGGEATYDGTSMAAPHVAGVVALIRQARPDLGPLQIEDAIRRSATDLGPAGADLDHGYGLVNATAALAAAAAAPVAAPPAPAPAPDASRPAARRAATPALLAQMRQNRRRALAAHARLRAIAGPAVRSRAALPRQHDVASVKPNAHHLLVTRRIALRTLDGARRLAKREGVARALPVVRVPRASAPVAFTPAAVREDTRLTRAVLRAVTRLERAARARR